MPQESNDIKFGEFKMVKKEYQFKDFSDKLTSKAMMKNQKVSLKYATEMCREIRGKSVKKVLKTLERILKQETYLPLKKYKLKVGHRKGTVVSGVKEGRFPEKICETFIRLVETAKGNASFKGLDEEKLIVLHAFASKGFSRMKKQPKGKVGGKMRKPKSTHLEIVLLEAKGM